MSSMGWKPAGEMEPPVEDGGMRGRLYFLRIVFLVVLVGLLYRVYWIQQTRGDELQTLASSNQFAELTTTASRGVIFDRNGEPLATNQPSFNVTITPAFLPGDDELEERQAVFERLSLLTGVPVTNTLQQQALIQAANPELVSTYTRLAEIYGAPVEETLNEAGVVEALPDSIEAIYEENSFAQYRPAVITSGIPITLAYQIEQESIFLPGVHVLPQPLRDYPSGAYTAHLIGYMGPIPNQSWIDTLGYERDDRVGWAGLESSMELELAGIKGERTIEQDWTGREVRQVGLGQEPQAGLNLHLTLDLDLQKITYEILGQFMQANEEAGKLDEITGERTFPESEQAAVVAMNPQTGEVLAMVSYPTFDNNRFQTSVPVEYYLSLERNDYTPLVNHAISGTYPPGSTFKLVPASAAMEEGIISPDRRLFDPGVIEIPNRFAPNDPGRVQPFVCWNQAGHGSVNMLLGIGLSCDVYFYKISGGFDQDGEFVEGLTVDRISQYAAQFGFGRVQGIELPLESPGILPSRAYKRQNFGEPWSTGDDYNLGIGQGFITSTPMQVAQMGAVVASGGFLYRPTLVHHMTDADGNVVIVDENSQVVARARPGPNGTAIVMDAAGNRIDDPAINIRFDANGEPIFQAEVIGSVAVDRQYLDIVAQGMRLVNTYVNEEEYYTGATYVDWLDNVGISTAGKTGTSEYCDNIAIDRGWCRFEDIAQRRILPTHSWFVGYAPFEDPEIVVSVFIFNGGEGSAWAAPVACHVMAAYFEVGQYGEIMGSATEETAEESTAGELVEETFEEEPPFACNSLSYIPDIPPLDQLPPLLGE